MASMPLIPALAALVCYAGICSLLRFSQVHKLRRHCNYPDRASLSAMTHQDAQTIVRNMASFEFPTFYNLSLRLALFKSYAIDNIAALLVTASDLTKPNQAPKRVEDTEIFIASFTKFPPSSPLLYQAIARMNYLHGPYIRSGKIRNEDLLYISYIAMSEPIRAIDLYEWRPLTDMEVAALSTLWKCIGDMMDIDYRAELDKDAWEDGIDFLTHLARWASEYEDKHLRRTREAQILGGILMDLLVSPYPTLLRPLGRQVALVLMGDRLRHVFRLPEPGIAATALMHTLLLARKLCMRFLALPRLTAVDSVSEPDPKTGRMHHLDYFLEPWYTPVTVWTRWSPGALLTWAIGGKVPGHGGAEMRPDGFLFEDLGPRSKMGKGLEAVTRFAELAQGKLSQRRPFSPPGPVSHGG